MTPRVARPMPAIHFATAILAMTVIVAGSNWLVQYPLNDWLTWGALSYPVAFLVADLLNRRYGPAAARRVAWFGFLAAVAVSAWLATGRIAAASGLAFLCSQWLDIYVFDRLRRHRWWQAPLVSGAFAATLDTSVFFAVAFAGSGAPWQTWLLGDLLVKLGVNLCMLAPFRALMWNLGRPGALGEYTQ